MTFSSFCLPFVPPILQLARIRTRDGEPCQARFAYSLSTHCRHRVSVDAVLRALRFSDPGDKLRQSTSSKGSFLPPSAPSTADVVFPNCFARRTLRGSEVGHKTTKIRTKTLSRQILKVSKFRRTHERRTNAKSLLYAGSGIREACRSIVRDPTERPERKRRKTPRSRHFSEVSAFFTALCRDGSLCGCRGLTDEAIRPQSENGRGGAQVYETPQSQQSNVVTISTAYQSRF